MEEVLSGLNLLHVTLYMPKSCKSIGKANKLLHEWRAGIESSGAIGWDGGIFLQLGKEGQAQLHCHLVLATNIPSPLMIERWHKVSIIPKGLCIAIKPIQYLEGILTYIFEKNINEAVNYKLVSYREHLTKHFTN
jgi:hypothetical protein